MNNLFLMLAEKIHRTIFLLGTAFLVIGLPVSYFLLSVAIIILTANWVLEFNFRTKWKILKNRKSLLLIISIYGIHLIWLFNTSIFDYAAHDLRIKLPLLLLPIIYGTTSVLTKKEFKTILLLFICTVFISSLITTYVLLGFSKLDPVDSRYASLFISHIRFSLMVVLSIYIVFYLLFFKEYQIRNFEKYVYSAGIIWLICFLILLQSFTGIVIFLILCPLAIIWWAHHQKNRTSLWVAYVSCFSILLVTILYAAFSIYRFNRRYEPLETNLETHTVNGNKYRHHANTDDFENGYKIWIYISDTELAQEWNNRSQFNIDSLDRKGQPLKITLIRYITSLGLRKDSLGVAQLFDEDIHMIEKGYANHIYKNKFAVYPRIYELLWEITRYQQNGDPSGQSLGQRIEYLKIGLNIVKRNFWLGTGTGDVEFEFKKQYELDKTLLKPEWRHRTHNQLITFLITFGVFGFLWILLALTAPALLENKYNNFLFVLFFILCILSMLNEDTLETHAGVSFFAFFYSFFLFSMPEEDKPENEQT